jgi:polygalacturonase
MKKYFILILISTFSFFQIKAQIGAMAMPETIAPISPPFDMPQLSKPQFPDYTVNIIQFGAKQKVNSTKAIQKAIDHISSKGGGQVIVPPGQWFCGRIELKNNVNLHLSENAELHFSGDIKDYLPVVFTRIEGVELYSLGACIYANSAHNIALTGKGKIIGPGKECEIYSQHINNFSLEEEVATVFPVEQRIYDGTGKIPAFLPMTFAPIHCSNVYVEGVTITKTIFWNIVPQYCENVIIRGVTVNSHGMGRTDGIDIESSRNVLVEYSTLDCGDDCFTIKSGRGEDGLRVNRPSENIVIRHCLALRGAGGVTCGSETAAMIRNVYVHDCIFDATTHGFYFKSRRIRGGGGENLHFERITMKNPAIAYSWSLLGSKKWVGELASRFPIRTITPLTPSYKNITFKDITVEHCNKLIDLIGLPEMPVTQVLIDRMSVKDSQELINIQDANGLVICNSALASTNNIITLTGATNIMFINTSFYIPNSKVQVIYKDKEYLPVLIK